MNMLNFLKGLGHALSKPLMKAGFVLTMMGIPALFFDLMWGALAITLGAAALAASWRLFKLTN